MRVLGAALFSFLISTTALAYCQQEPMPDKLSPEAVKALREQEQKMTDSIQESRKHPGPTFEPLQCRADAQKWTADPSDDKDARNLRVSIVIMVNGQLRSMPSITSHVTVSGLQDRIYEMAVCEDKDASFEKQFVTYSLMHKAYQEELSFRYFAFLMSHHLYDQFVKEDAEANK